MFFAELPIQAPPASFYEYVVPIKEVNEIPYIPKTQLFVDVNWTVTCLDSHGYDTDEKLMAVFAADIARQVVGVWEPGLKEMSYHDYVELYLFPFAPDLTQAERNLIIADRNIEYAKIFDRLNEQDRDYWLNKVQLAKEKHKALGNNRVFPSFIKLIQKYQNDDSVQIVLRTFGIDGPLVMQEVNDRVGPYFNMNAYKLSYVDSDYFRLQHPGEQDQMIHRKELATKIYQLGNCVIRDDVDTWIRERFSLSYAKAFPVDLNPEYKRLFFDDNSWAKPIISPYNAETGIHIELSEEIAPRFSTIDMLLDDDLMIKLVE